MEVSNIVIWNNVIVEEDKDIVNIYKDIDQQTQAPILENYSPENQKVLVKVAKDGLRGLFASKSIKKGEKVTSFVGVPFESVPLQKNKVVKVWKIRNGSIEEEETAVPSIDPTYLLVKDNSIHDTLSSAKKEKEKEQQENMPTKRVYEWKDSKSIPKRARKGNDNAIYMGSGPFNIPWALGAYANQVQIPYYMNVYNRSGYCVYYNSDQTLRLDVNNEHIIIPNTKIVWDDWDWPALVAVVDISPGEEILYIQENHWHLLQAFYMDSGYINNAFSCLIPSPYETLPAIISELVAYPIPNPEIIRKYNYLSKKDDKTLSTKENPVVTNDSPLGMKKKQEKFDEKLSDMYIFFGAAAIFDGGRVVGRGTLEDAAMGMFNISLKDLIIPSMSTGGMGNVMEHKNIVVHNSLEWMQKCFLAPTTEAELIYDFTSWTYPCPIEVEGDTPRIVSFYHALRDIIAQGIAPKGIFTKSKVCGFVEVPNGGCPEWLEFFKELPAQSNNQDTLASWVLGTSSNTIANYLYEALIDSSISTRPYFFEIVSNTIDMHKTSIAKVVHTTTEINIKNKIEVNNSNIYIICGFDPTIRDFIPSVSIMEYNIKRTPPVGHTIFIEPHDYYLEVEAVFVLGDLGKYAINFSSKGIPNVPPGFKKSRVFSVKKRVLQSVPELYHLPPSTRSIDKSNSTLLNKKYVFGWKKWTADTDMISTSYRDTLTGFCLYTNYGKPSDKFYSKQKPDAMIFVPFVIPNSRQRYIELIVEKSLNIENVSVSFTFHLHLHEKSDEVGAPASEKKPFTLLSNLAKGESSIIWNIH